MKAVIRTVTLLGIMFTSQASQAQGPGWTAFSDVKELVVTANGGVNVRLEPSLTGCTSQSGYGPTFASIYPNHPGIDRILSNLLAAYMSGKQVRLYLGDSTCTVGEMRMQQ